MLRNEKTETILRQFRKKSKKIINKNLYTEFFYLNKNRKIIEFLEYNNELIINKFYKEFLSSKIKDFTDLRLINEFEEEIKVWYYEEENLTLQFSINWGNHQTEVNISLDIENFKLTILDTAGLMGKFLDHELLNDYLVSIITKQAKYFSTIQKEIVNSNN